MVTMNISDMNISWDMSDMNDTVDGNTKSIFLVNGGFGKPVERHYPSRSTRKEVTADLENHRDSTPSVKSQGCHPSFQYEKALVNLNHHLNQYVTS